MASCYEGDLAIADAAEPVDFDAVMTRVHEAVQRIAPNDSAESLERGGVRTGCRRRGSSHEQSPRLGRRRRDAASRVVTVEHATLDRAVAESSTGGFTQVITDRRGVILGATIVGPRAGETLGEVALAVRHSLTASQVAGTTHAYPTFNDAFWNACISISGTRLRTGLTGCITRILASISRARLG